MRDKNKSWDVLFRRGPKLDSIFNVLGGGEWFGVFILQNVAIPGLGNSQSSIHVTWRATCREMAINIVSNDKIDAYTRCKIKRISLVDWEQIIWSKMNRSMHCLDIESPIWSLFLNIFEFPKIIYHDHELFLRTILKKAKFWWFWSQFLQVNRRAVSTFVSRFVKQSFLFARDLHTQRLYDNSVSYILKSNIQSFEPMSYIGLESFTKGYLGLWKIVVLRE